MLVNLGLHFNVELLLHVVVYKTLCSFVKYVVTSVLADHREINNFVHCLPLIYKGDFKRGDPKRSIVFVIIAYTFLVTIVA